MPFWQGVSDMCRLHVIPLHGEGLPLGAGPMRTQRLQTFCTPEIGFQYVVGPDGHDEKEAVLCCRSYRSPSTCKQTKL